LLITDRRQAKRPLVEVVEEAFRGGCRFASLREKDLSPAERLALLREILPVARKWGAILLVHADLEAARHCDGVHLGAGGDVAAARAALGPEARIGLSCHTVEEVRAAMGADYVTLGPVAETASKPGYAPRIGPEELREAAKLGISVYALGGVDAGNAAVFRDAGAVGVAVMGGVMGREDPEGAVRWLLEAWGAPAHQCGPSGGAS
jgi:thiamine-phosphate pyrophosphorylase